jgi:beta-lactamase regulating signal transducer with metallopeptidase domain
MITESKNILASCLALEDISIVYQPDIDTPMFHSDTREIYIPIYKFDEFSESFHDMIIGHEVGHAKWSETNQQKIETMAKQVCDSFNVGFSYLNIIEDIRIE